MLLGVIETAAVINIAQIMLGACGILSAGIISTSKHLGWESKASLHEQYAARYSEIVRTINTEATLRKLDDSSFASTHRRVHKKLAGRVG